MGLLNFEFTSVSDLNLGFVQIGIETWAISVQLLVHGDRELSGSGTICCNFTDTIYSFDDALP